jgi:UDPglucose--hexose-1-phosphate uridylyltransferase
MPKSNTLFEHPHRRFDPLQREWVLVSPHRAKRPWQGAIESNAEEVLPYDPECFLCPGNARTSGEINPMYTRTHSFPNDFPALLPRLTADIKGKELFRAEPVGGECRVLCYSPRHDVSLSTMSTTQVRSVVDLWVATAAELGARYDWVQIFENRGATMGMSSPHPHGQVWAMDVIPTLVAKEEASQSDYLRDHGTPMLLEVAIDEISTGDRVVCANDHWVWLVPFWAVWPFEILLLPRSRASRFENLSEDQLDGLASILSDGLARFDRLFGCPFPYSMGWHFAPYNNNQREAWQLHAHFYPPLLRSASIRKFWVGFEMMAEAQRDITPEEAAERLRNA